ncbi:MAG TPA: hypothetical protein VGW33_05940 [Terriglobia bacterium]|nr:hypothetical protein [Terriglobia bacterium]
MSEAQQSGLQSCYVDGVTITTIASCVSLLQGTTTGTQFGGVITTSFPEHIQTLPWDPGLFTGTLQVGKAPIAHGSLNTCTVSALNCWLTEVPIIIGSGMSIAGSGKVPGTGSGANPNFAEGTAIMPGSSFPIPLGAPTNPTLTCLVGTGGTLMGGKTYQIAFVEVNNLDTNSSSTALLVPGLSAESSPTGVLCNATTCASNNCVITGSAPATLNATGTIPAQDYRVFASIANGPAGSETLQVPGQGMTCTGTPHVDTNYGCQLGSNTFTITSITTGGDHPNVVDLSNPLVVEIGPVVGSNTSSPPTAHNEGFWARLENLTLALPGTAVANDPNVVFWNPSDQENSGMSFVGITGQVASTTPAETGAWIYIGPHAPNSFVSISRATPTRPAARSTA